MNLPNIPNKIKIKIPKKGNILVAENGFVATFTGETKNKDISGTMTQIYLHDKGYVDKNMYNLTWFALNATDYNKLIKECHIIYINNI